MDQISRPTKTKNDYRSEAYKSQYAAEYEHAKSEGEPFFPNVIYQDSVVSMLVFLAVFALAIFVGAPLEAKADPTDLSVVPRPEWYFLFLFQFLKYVPSQLESLIGVFVPGFAVTFLLLLPIIDRNPRRRPSGRPLAYGLGVIVVCGVVFLSIQGSLSQPPTVTTSPDQSSPQVLAGRQVYQTNGCAGCHRIGVTGGTVGPELTHVGSQLDTQYLREFIANPKSKNPTSPMPSFSSLSANDLNSLVEYLSSLK